MELSTIPECSVETGVIQEERSIKWKINNFPVVLKHSAMITAQQVDFYAGESIGMASKWGVYLRAEKVDGGTWAGIYLRLKEKPVLTSEHLCVQFIFTFKNKNGAVVVKQKYDSKVVDFCDAKLVKAPEEGLGFQQIFDMNGELPSHMELNDGTLVVHVTFRIFALSKAIHPLKDKVEEFEVKSTAKALADLDMMMGDPVAANDIRIIANDKTEFKMQKGVLSARSPVFRAMLEADMTEGNAGVVEIQDMGSKSLKTMLRFLNRGELLPEWMLSDVLVELTNAAAKYELKDLLQFLDGVLGDVCNLHNVGELIALASRLSLKRAEADLLSFVKRKGASSSENFLRVANGILASESRAEGGSGQEASTGPSGDQVGGRNKRRNDEDNEDGKSRSKPPPKKTRRSRK